MPEYPDITLYQEHFSTLLTGQRLEKIRLRHPFLLRTVDPPLPSFEGNTVLAVSRIGKQIVWEFKGELYLIFHLMVAGRFHWRIAGAKAGGRNSLAAFDFSAGSVLLTEAGSRRRASLHCVRSRESLRAFDRGGIDPVNATAAAFRAALVRENHTLKRALTDPRLFSGIGNAYSDEILHRAGLSPFRQTRALSEDEADRLHTATVAILREWTEKLRKETGDTFPEDVTAFRPDMAVHGKFGRPCPVCVTAVQRIVYAENECNYCPRCQTGGSVLADRSLSRLLHSDWPRSIEELEADPVLGRK